MLRHTINRTHCRAGLVTWLHCAILLAFLLTLLPNATAQVKRDLQESKSQQRHMVISTSPQDGLGDTPREHIVDVETNQKPEAVIELKRLRLFQEFGSWKDSDDADRYADEPNDPGDVGGEGTDSSDGE